MSVGTNPGNTKGSTDAQNNLLNSQQQFTTTLQNDFGTTFAGQQNIINGLNKSLETTVNAGPGQFGFTAPEETALNTSATTGNSQAYQNARAASGEAAAASGEGSAQLPTGANAANEATLASNAATNQSNSLLGIQEAGYKQGVQNYDTAVSGETSVAGLENPNSYASNANTSGTATGNTAATIQKANAAANPWAQVGGLVGSLLGAAPNASGPGASTFTGGFSSAAQAQASGGQNPATIANPIQTSGDTTNYQIPSQQ